MLETTCKILKKKENYKNDKLWRIVLTSLNIDEIGWNEKIDLGIIENSLIYYIVIIFKQSSKLNVKIVIY